MPNKKDPELPEAANQKAIEKKLKEILGPNAEESTHEEAEWLRQGRSKPQVQPQPEALPNTPGAPEVQSAEVTTPESVTQEPLTEPIEQPTEPLPEPEASVADTELTAEDKETEEAVDDIVEEESDEVLAAEDKEINEAFEKPKQHSFGDKVKDFFRRWWNNPRARWTTIIITVVLLVAAVVIPTSRYFVLNSVGVRSSASIVVLDDSTSQPLKNVSVSIGKTTASTNSDGVAQLSHIKLGTNQMTVEKRAFAPQTKTIVVGWGSNPLGNLSLKAVGAQYTFIAKDWLSGKPIEKAEASSGDASALSDKDGKIVLTVDTSESAKLDVTIKAAAYRDESLSFDAANKAVQTVNMVSGRKDVFVSKRSGKYDVYKVDVDGKNEELVLKGTGNEQDNMTLISHPSDEVVAYVSTRDNVRNKDGFLLSTMLLIDLSDNTTINLAQSERIQPLGWIGDNLVYAQIAAGASANNPKRHRLIAYNYKTNDKKELASGNSFNDALIAADNIYYAPSSFAGSGAGLFKSNADGSRLSITNQEVWSIFRTAYDTLDLSVQQDWYEYKLGDVKTHKLSGAPANLNARVYIDSPDNKHSLWVDQRDGKGVLLAYDVNVKSDKTLQTKSGLNNPLRWLNDQTVIFRVHTDQETADYVMNINGGEPKKIKDVTNTLGIDRWYYY